MKGLEEAYSKLNIRYIFPVHPRTKKILEINNVKLFEGITVLEPLGYLDFVTLEKNAAGIITDSGGVQEEACILHVPCITTRISTERPETVEVGANEVVGLEPSIICQGIKTMIQKNRIWINPFGDGTTGKQIVEICSSYLNKGDTTCYQ